MEFTPLGLKASLTPNDRVEVDVSFNLVGVNATCIESGSRNMHMIWARDPKRDVTNMLYRTRDPYLGRASAFGS